MLRELRIKNFTIIDDLAINFESGFNVLTGETGAGKSIIVDALGLLLGDKASQDMIKADKKEASIEAYFDNTEHSLLKDVDIESDEGIIMRRSITLQGKGRAYVNDTPVNIQTLANIGRSLIDIHGQHEHQCLLRKESHLQLLDSSGGLADDTAVLKSLYGEAASLKERLNELRERFRERNQKIEFLMFQINEIDSADLKIGEKEDISEERNILLNLSRLKESSSEAYRLLYESEGSCLEKLSSAVTRIKEMASFDHSAKELLGMLESALPTIEDAAISCRKLKEKYNISPERLTEVDERLELVKRLEKKYGEGIDGILDYRKKAWDELKGLEQMDIQMEDLQSELKTKEDMLRAMAEKISEKRFKIAEDMQMLALEELKYLGFQKAEFKIGIKRRDAVSQDGIDDVEFLFSANPGEPLKPLIKVASGGELSRIMLALKCILLKGHGSWVMGHEKKELTTCPLPLAPMTLIFDEVDAGIGGITAGHVGKRLKEIAKNYQVFCITHLPQIAARAGNHLKVEKVTVKDSVKVNIEPLTGNKRQDEIARMLSGKITDVSRKHAKELLGDQF